MSRSVAETVDRPLFAMRAHWRAMTVPLLWGGVLSLIPTLLGQVLMSTLTEAATTNPTPAASIAMLGATWGVTFFAFVATACRLLLAFGVSAAALDGRRFTLRDGLATLHPGRLVLVFPTFILTMLCFGCGFVGGPAVGMVFALGWAALFHETGARPLGALQEGAALAFHNPGGAIRTLPALRVAAVLSAWYLLAMALSSPAAIVVWAGMAWSAWDAMAQGGDPTVAMQTIPPWIAVLSSLVGIVPQLFGEAFLAMGLTLVYRDVVEEREGRELALRVASA